MPALRDTRFEVGCPGSSIFFCIPAAVLSAISGLPSVREQSSKHEGGQEQFGLHPWPVSSEKNF